MKIQNIILISSKTDCSKKGIKKNDASAAKGLSGWANQYHWNYITLMGTIQIIGLKTFKYCVQIVMHLQKTIEAEQRVHIRKLMM